MGWVSPPSAVREKVPPSPKGGQGQRGSVGKTLGTEGAERVGAAEGSSSVSEVPPSNKTGMGAAPAF